MSNVKILNCVAESFIEVYNRDADYKLPEGIEVLACKFLSHNRKSIMACKMVDESYNLYEIDKGVINHTPLNSSDNKINIMFEFDSIQ